MMRTAQYGGPDPAAAPDARAKLPSLASEEAPPSTNNFRGESERVATLFL
jgi:hypothetical protein